MERVERVEQEKQERLEIAKMKKGRSMAKNKNTKTKPKSNEVGTSEGRMENRKNKKRLEGTKLMKSNLWKQRREQDGRLVTVWKEIKKKRKEDGTEENQPKGRQGTSPQEEQEPIPQEDTSNGDLWLEELILTEAERIKLLELEHWWQETNDHPPGRTMQPPRGSTLDTLYVHIATIASFLIENR